jgi:ATP-dependent 26S proteasome regulatory subunit
MLDAAILKRPGRFERVFAFHPPNRNLRVDYLHRLSRGKLEMQEQELRSAAPEADGFSFAQLRELHSCGAACV